MKKLWAVVSCALLTALAGCGTEVETTSLPVESAAASEVAVSPVESSAAVEVEAPEDYEAVAARFVQMALDGYADGSYPEELVIGTDVAAVPPVPEGTALPASLDEAVYTCEYVDSEMWGDMLEVRVVLANDYRMEILILLPSEYWPDPALLRISYMDEQEWCEGGSHTEPGLTLADIEGNRLWLSARIEHLDFAGVDVSGQISWDGAWRVLWIDLSRDDDTVGIYACTTYEIDEDGAASLYFSYDELSPFSAPFDDEAEMQRVAEMLYTALIGAF